MNEKPAFREIEQRTNPQGARSNLRFNPMDNSAVYGKIGDAIGALGVGLAKAQDKYNNLKMQNFEEQLNNQYKEMNNKLLASQNPEEYDAIVRDTLAQMKTSGKNYLGDKLFNQWEADYGGNYYDALRADVTGQKIGLLQKLSYQTAQETVRQKAYDYGYAPKAAQAQMDNDFKAYLEINGFTPMQKAQLAKQYDTQKTQANLEYLLDTDPRQIAYMDKNGKIISPMDDKDKYTNLTIAEKVDWKNKALRVQKAQKDALEKGLLKEEAGQYAINKVRVLSRLDVLKEQIGQDEELDPYKLFSFLQQVNDFATKPETGYKNHNGEIAYYLEPNEAYSYQKEVAKYWGEALDSIENQPNDSYFSYGLKAINLFFNQEKDFNGLNDFDKMDIVQEYYRQMTAAMPADVMQSKADIGYQKETMDAARTAIQSFAMRSKKFNQYAKNVILTTPPEIKTRTIPNIQSGPEEYTTVKRGTVAGIGQFDMDKVLKRYGGQK